MDREKIDEYWNKNYKLVRRLIEECGFSEFRIETTVRESIGSHVVTRFEVPVRGNRGAMNKLAAIKWVKKVKQTTKGGRKWQTYKAYRTMKEFEK